MKYFSKRRIALFFVVAFYVTCSRQVLADNGYDDSFEDDTTSPNVVAIDPHNNAEGVPVNARIRATFSEDMDPSSITSDTFTVTDSFGSPVYGEVSYSNRTAAFIPFTHFAELTSYVANISSHMRDDSGNSLWSDYSWMFMTGSE